MNNKSNQQVFYGKLQEFINFIMLFKDYKIIYNPTDIQEIISFTFFPIKYGIYCEDVKVFQKLKGKFDGILFLESDITVDGAIKLHEEKILEYTDLPIHIKKQIITFSQFENIYSLITKYKILGEISIDIINEEKNPIYFMKNLPYSSYNKILKTMYKTLEYKFLKHGSKYIVSYIESVDALLKELNI